MRIVNEKKKYRTTGVHWLHGCSGNRKPVGSYYINLYESIIIYEC